LDEAATRQLYASGCRKLQFGLESYSQRVLNLMRKGTKIEHMLPNIEACLASGIAVHLFVIVGFPGEREEEAWRTYEFCRAVLELSETRYGLPYSSVGISPFRLSFFPDVHVRPEQYGVELIDLRDRDDPLDIFTVDYRTASGLSAARAEELVALFRGRDDQDGVLRQLGYINPAHVATPFPEIWRNKFVPQPDLRKSELAGCGNSRASKGIW